MQQCVYQIKFRSVCEIKSDSYSLDWSGAEHYRYCCQWMERVSPCLCLHSEPTLHAILLQAAKKWDNWMKCRPKCQKCEQNVFLRVMLIKQSYRIGWKSDISLVVISLGNAKTNVRWNRKLNGHMMASCVENILTKTY